MKERTLMSDVIKWLRFPLVVGVVFIHCLNVILDVDDIHFGDLSAVDCYNLLRIAVSNVLSRVCVPLFFTISGYLFFTNLEKWNWSVCVQKLKKRVQGILIPYLLWITIAILYHVAILLAKGGGGVAVSTFFSENGYWHLYWDCFELDPVKLSWTGMEVHSSTPYHYALWYLRDLMVMMVLSPCFYFLFKRLKIWGLALLAINYVSNICAFVPELLPTPLFFFGAGAYLQINKIDATKCFRPYEKVFYVFALLLFFVCVRFNSFLTYTGNLFFPFFVITGSISTFNIATRIVEKRGLGRMEKLSNEAFFIYLVHPIAITPLCVHAVDVICKGNPYALSLGYLVLPFIIISICLAICWMLKRFIPALYSILTGGR
mgnify:CR=1 FL=1